ncbi:VENN motif pre-toxin domain-containing protein [Burkholderia ubonensis]|uniref:VENN motif pre-toxin domain-containing protein n=1 Tax=Burkholderia ubonensis TaxID=101571 RepID=UPI001E2BCB08|nr:VENN motif pre-toxin domain-containing protein [Burkholderia ubonensis]
MSAAFSPDVVKALDPSGAPLDSGQRAVLAAFATLAGGGFAGLAGQNAMAGATAAQNEAMNNTDPHAADAAQNGGIATRVKNVVKDWLSFTFSNPGGSVNNWKNQFIGDMQRDFGRRTQPTDANRQLDPSGGDSDKGGPTAHAVVTAISAIGCMLTRGAACGLMTLPLASPGGRAE